MASEHDHNPGPDSDSKMPGTDKATESAFQKAHRETCELLEKSGFRKMRTGQKASIFQKEVPPEKPVVPITPIPWPQVCDLFVRGMRHILTPFVFDVTHELWDKPGIGSGATFTFRHKLVGLGDNPGEWIDKQDMTEANVRNCTVIEFVTKFLGYAASDIIAQAMAKMLVSHRDTLVKEISQLVLDNGEQ